MSEPTQVVLNIHYIKNQIMELGLKQWWLAERVGVDVKTLRRWLQGKVKNVRVENAEALAQVLGCGLDEITLTDDTQLYATEEDQKTAASLVAGSQLLTKLGPIGEWDVIEALLKSTVVPTLPKYVLGELYNSLSIAAWRQSKIDDAHVYATKALDIGESISDKATIAGALLNLANIHSWRGESKFSLEKYHLSLQFKPFIEPLRYGSILSNIGSVSWEIGLMDDAVTYQEEAIKVFEKHGNAMNLSICYCQLAFIDLEAKNLDTARKNAEFSIELAKKDEYKRGLAMGSLVIANIEALQKNEQIAKFYLASGLDGFKEAGIEEGFNYLFAGRTSRLLDEPEVAEGYLREGIKISEKYPLYLAMLYEEFAELKSGDETTEAFASEYFQKAKDLYLKVDAEARASRLKA